ncbi:uncharacterized protein ISCGN_022481 [Ixodes scapularis]
MEGSFHTSAIHKRALERLKCDVFEKPVRVADSSTLSEEPEITAGATDPQELNAGQAVWTKKFPSSQGWITGVVERRMGLRSWMVRIDQGLVRRHRNRIRKRWTNTEVREKADKWPPVWDIEMDSSASTQPPSHSSDSRAQPTRSHPGAGDKPTTSP